MPKYNPLIMRNYKSNKKLKASGVKMQFTKEQIAERVRCAQDPIYFIKNYVKIVTADDGIVNFELWPFQEKLINTIHENRFTIAKLPRQVGKSTTSVSYILWSVLFERDQTIGILANKASTAREILARLQKAYEHLPLWMQQGILTWNKGFIELENGSRVIAGSTSSDGPRGFTYNMIMLDEFAFIPHTIAEEFMTSAYPTITSGKTTKVVMVSTPKGMNMFYHYWIEAIEGRSRYVPIEVHWSDVPGRDEKWYEEQVANMGEEKCRQEFDCEFLGSTSTLIAPSKLSTFSWRTPLIERHGVSMYEEPKNNHLYCTIVDTASGQGQDYSAFSIIDITKMPYRQVCVYRSNKIDPILFPTVIKNVSQQYNNSWVLIETNNIGTQTARILCDDLEYENVFSTTSRGRGGQQLTAGFKKSSKIGVTMSEAIKTTGCSNLKTLLESSQLIVNDKNTISELATFVATGKSYAAEPGMHDDIVDTLVLFGWLSIQPLFKELNDQDLRKRLERSNVEGESTEILPFGYVNDGYEEEYFVEDGSIWETVDHDYTNSINLNFWKDDDFSGGNSGF